ncbi:hypothetical protein M758_2G177900 [Ceratodon purpureus]|nr:hypothetical protein M758_2G177600 [Ceratodon purpureus]KAG0627155.1 hypothetical protein M758_2G177900 [Ceratodon purpureus]
MYRVQSAGLCGMCLCVGDMFWMLDVADWVGYVADCGACEEAYCTIYWRRVVRRADCVHCGGVLCLEWYMYENVVGVCV